MRATLRPLMRIRAIPSSAVPASELRLPPQGYRAAKRTNQDAVTISAVEQAASSSPKGLPSNLRLEEFIPPRQLYAGISEEDREILKKLARE